MGLSNLKLNFILHMVLLAIWLSGLATVNLQSSEPIAIIFPYLIPVVFFTWRYGIKWGFISASLATLSSMTVFSVHEYMGIDMAYAGIFTYAKLSGAAIGVSVAKKIHNNRNCT